MKLQYLGDSKDSFKWDYHHFLVDKLGYRQLKIVWMMTTDDAGTQGKTAAELFPAKSEIIQLCHELRKSRNPELLYQLPAVTGAGYEVTFHEPPETDNKNEKFATIFTFTSQAKQVVFLDPDNGFEPEQSYSEKHVRYSEVEKLLQNVSPSTVITIFQHHRRKRFPDDFARIRERLISGFSTAIYWHSLMFVILSSCQDTIEQVSEVNRLYALNRPVKLLT